MKCLLTSDSHRGFDKNTHKIHEKFLIKIAEEKPDVVIHAGDWASNQQKQLEATFKQWRGALPNIPIICVFGNHDYWCHKERFSYQTMQDFHKKILKDFDIHHLGHSGPYETPDVIFAGYDGWYSHVNPPTNDAINVPKDLTHDIMSKKAHQDILNILDLTSEKTIVGISHFPPFTENYLYLPYCANPLYMDPITEKCDVFCVGHSHKACDFIKNDCRVLNAGSDYNKPAYIVFTA